MAKKKKEAELDENMFKDDYADSLDNSYSDLDSNPNTEDYSTQPNTPSNNNFDLYGDNEVESDNSRWELDPDDVFNRLEHLMRSERISKDGSKWIKVKGVDAFMNERGIFEIMRDLNLYINKNTVLANIDNRLMCKIMRNIGVTLVFRLKNQYKEFDIKKHNLSYVQRTIENEIVLFLTRALGGMERKIRRDKFRFNENVNNNNNGGFMGGLFNKKPKTGLNI